MENFRYNISPCTKAEVDAFIGRLDSKLYVPNGSVKSTEHSHYDRYSFLCEEQRIAIVYDLSAKIISITARQDLAKQLLDEFNPQNKSVKKSTVPAGGSNRQGQQQIQQQQQSKAGRDDPPLPDMPPVRGKWISDENNPSRAKLFVSADRLKRRSEYVPVPTVLATSRGVIVTTDEIYPPQTVKRNNNNNGVNNGNDSNVGNNSSNNNGNKQGQVVQPTDVQRVQKRSLTSYGEMPTKSSAAQTVTLRNQQESANSDKESYGIAISVGSSRLSGSAATPRRAVISFGSEDDGKAHKTDIKITTRTIAQSSQKQPSSVGQAEANAEQQKRGRGRPKKNKQTSDDGGVNASAADTQQQLRPEAQADDTQQQKRGRGRPKKSEVVAKPEQQAQPEKTPEYKNGYSVKNYPPDALGGAIRRLREYGKTVVSDGVEFAGTPQEIKAYTVTDENGQKVILRYATKRMTLQLQGKRSELFGEVMAQVSHDSDYSSALENYVEKPDTATAAGKARNRVSDVQNKLKKRLPTAYGYLSEQSRIDFSYGIHDFDQKDLHLSDYSVLLVPAFRGLERFIFDLQAVENINVKMIGQAFDKDASGKYVLKSGYLRRINSIIYPEVLVALYTEYFSQRNFFAHSDNTGGNASRSLPERADAQRIFEQLLDVVEYNAKKLKEIGFSIHK